jgi:hypothetical protein
MEISIMKPTQAKPRSSHIRLLRELSTLLLFLSMLANPLAVHAAPPGAASGVITPSGQLSGLDPELVQTIAQAPNQRGDGIVFLQAQADLSGAAAIADWQNGIAE